jgi:hypothetical protein
MAPDLCNTPLVAGEENMYNRPIAILTAVIAVTALAPLPAHAGCKEKVAEIDAWVADIDIDSNTLAGVKMMRDQGAAMCAQGNEAASMQLLEMVAVALPQTKSQVTAEQKANVNSKAKITDKFLAGTWCAIVDQEHSQYIFSVDGTYRACVHDSMAGPYGHCMPPQSTSEWLAKYKLAKTVEQNALVLGGNTSRNDYATFKRGECKLYGR